jgi:MFS family permease
VRLAFTWLRAFRPAVPTIQSTPPLLSRKAVIAVVIGNWLEFYDFLAFTFFAVMIGRAFFPGDSEFGRLLSALATFGVGFFTRPLGAAVIGTYADRAGRRAAMTLTLMLMAVGSAMMGLAPTYAQIGIAAPIILVVARLLQGFSCGGEVGPATAYLLESAPPEKRVAMAGWQGYSQILALLSGSLAGVALTTILSEEQLYSWGWRLPFLLGILIAPVGLYIRRQLPETIQPGEMHTSMRAILTDLVRHHARPVLLGVLIICGGTVSTYVFTYMTTYAITTLHLSPAIGTTLSSLGYVAQLAGGVVGVWASRFGQKTVLMASRIVFAISIYPAFVIITSPESSLVALFAVYMAISALFSMGIVPLYAFLLEAFPKAVRSSGLSILYALGTTIFGGTTQFVVAWLIERTGSPMVPAWYMLATTIAATIGVFGLIPHPEAARERAEGRLKTAPT